MHDVLAGLPMPSPTGEQVDPELVTPGFWGFAIIILIAFAVIFLVWDMMRRIRRGRVRADIQDELLAEQQGEEATLASDVDDQDIDPIDDPERRA